MGMIQNKVTVSQPNSHVVVKNAGGLRGLTGETGPQGPQGVPGEAATVTAGTTTTLPAGSNATVQNVGSTSAAIFNFGIPKGDKGDTGETGAAATISVGTTTTLEPGEDATVTNSGTSSAAVFDFGIPKGAKGDTGSQGPAGQDGADGFSPTATVTKTGDTATITITDKDGTTTAQISDGVTPTIDPALSPTSENPVQNKVVTNALAGKADKPIVVSSLPITGTAGQEYFVDDRYNTVTELKGDTTQTTYSGKNLYEGSPSFSSYNSISAWEDGGTYNGMPVIKRAAAWTGVYRLIDIEAGLTYTFSAWVKSDEARPVAIYAIGSGATATITPNNKNITTSTSWERVSFTFTCSTSGTVALRFENTSASTTNYTYISGYQLEKNSSMTSFEPYVGGTASPNPDYPQEVQTVTGEQTVTVVGKNLLDNSHPTTVSANTTWTPTANGGLYSATTGWTGGVQWRLTVEEGATYQFQYKERTNQNLYLYISTFTDATYTTVKTLIVNDGRYTKYPIVPDSPYLKITFNNSAAMTNVAIEELMFEKADERTPYVPYQGGSYPVNLGKNLLNPATLTADSRLNGDGTLLSGATGFSTSDYIPVEPNTTYTITRNAASTGFFGNLCQYDSSKTLVGTREYWDNTASYWPFHITTSSTTRYIRVSDQTTLFGTSFQIEKGSSATTYAPYFTPIELCKIGDYQDYIYKSGNDWYVHKEANKINYTSSDTFVAGSSGGYYYFSKARPADAKPAELCYSNCFNFNSAYTNNDDSVYMGNSNIIFSRVLVNGSYITTAANFSNWMANQTVDVYYPLATATDTQITNATLISQLEALAGAKIMVDGGTATVTSQYLPATLTTAYNSNSGYIDYIYDGTNFVKVR